MNKILATAATLVFSTAALAGSSFTPEVVINDNSAYGALRAVRQSQDKIQYIGCTVYTGRFGSSATCFARDILGETESCSTTSAEMMQVISSIDADNTLYFEWNASGECTAVAVHRNSDSIAYEES
ncbi:hypothetical protein [Microbulbifer taiwanensis]|uniref:Uncharacterized protein n=1 Tax=Microbulbifer taiwanensis TaxID=986746 RepID=A0ABW1YRC8_9GAMM|nr:hypothetical protein [Microbulbifer taiwanensis]